MVKINEQFFDKTSSKKVGVESDGKDFRPFGVRAIVEYGDLEHLAMRKAFPADPEEDDPSDEEYTDKQIGLMVKFAKRTERFIKSMKLFNGFGKSYLQIIRDEEYITKDASPYDEKTHEMINGLILHGAENHENFCIDFLYEVSFKDSETLSYIDFKKGFLRFVQTTHEMLSQIESLTDLTYGSQIEYICGNHHRFSYDDIDEVYIKSCYGKCIQRNDDDKNWFEYTKDFHLEWNGFKNLSEDSKPLSEWKHGDVLYSNVTGDLTDKSDGGVPIAIFVEPRHYRKLTFTDENKEHALLHSGDYIYGVFISLNYMDFITPEDGSKIYKTLPFGFTDSELTTYWDQGIKNTIELYEKMETADNVFDYGDAVIRCQTDPREGTDMALLWAVYRYRTVGTKSGDWVLPSITDLNGLSFNWKTISQTRSRLGLPWCSGENINLWVNNASEKHKAMCFNVEQPQHPRQLPRNYVDFAGAFASLSVLDANVKYEEYDTPIERKLL